MTKRKKIAILTGGGDVPGLNVAIKAVVVRAHASDIDVVGIRRGWKGLMSIDPSDHHTTGKWTMPLTVENVRDDRPYGRDDPHTSRTNPSNVSANDIPEVVPSRIVCRRRTGRWTAQKHVTKVLDALSIDAVIPIGGDDTLSYACRLHREGVQIVAIPKTMDNDVFVDRFLP